MTSEPDSKPGRRPPTIELKATEVETPAPAQNTGAAEPAGAASHEAAAEPSPGATPPGGRSRNQLKLYAVGAGVSALAIVAVIAGLWVAGYLPTGSATSASNTTAPSTVAPPSTISGDLAARLDKIERAVQAQHQELQHQELQHQEPAAIPPALGNRLTATEAQTKSFADQLAAVNRRIDDLTAASQNAAKQAGAAAATADAAKQAAQDAAKDSQKNVSQGGVQQSDIDAMTNRVASLESAVKALSDSAAHPSGTGSDTAARLSVAAEALRAAVERGAPYQAELAAVQSLGADQSTLAPLVPFAASGVPSAILLSRELAFLTPALQQAVHAAPGETTFLGRLEANAQKLVRVTPVDTPAGTDPLTAIGRIALDAARADIPAALTDIAALSDSAKPLFADWIAKAHARDAAIAASRKIAADALAALGKPASQ
jgi:hypothetical protein